MPVEDEIHRCELLEYSSRYLEFCCEGESNARWRLIYAPQGAPRFDDEVILQNVLYCPCCGKDLRNGVGSGRVGKPKLQEILSDLLEKK